MNADLPPTPNPKGREDNAFRSAVLRGLGVFLPPLLTVVIFFWIFGTVYDYVLEPVETVTRRLLVYSMADVREDPDLQQTVENIGGFSYRRTSDDSYVPLNVFETVMQQDGRVAAQRMTGEGIYERYVQIRFLKPQYVIPAFLVLFILMLYLVGRFLGARLGRFMLHRVEGGIARVPMVRKVYSSVKQVTDFMFSKQDLQFTRVVAVEYPRKDTWTLAFVTGESLLDIRERAGEPILAVLVPTSPLPMTGFTTTVLRSECIDLNMTVEEAIEYIVSCGVVVPMHQFHTDYPSDDEESPAVGTSPAKASAAGASAARRDRPEALTSSENQQVGNGDLAADRSQPSGRSQGKGK